MDLSLPHMNGLEAARQLREIAPDAHVVIVSIHEAEQYREEAAALGVSGYVPKRVMRTELVPLMRQLLSAAGRPTRA
jgi:DNA-binding NarL/FixJ family response regulator